MAFTTLQLKDQCRERCDMVNSKFIDPDDGEEWNKMISASYASLYDLLVAKFEDYSRVKKLFTVASGVQEETLPADFYKLRGIDRDLGGSQFYAIRTFNFEDRNIRQSTHIFRGVYPDVRYRIIGNTLLLSPEDQAAGDYRMWYVPRPETKTADTDSIDGVAGWEEYIVADVCIKALAKEESDTGVFERQRAEMVKRIEEMAANRDVGATQKVTDIESQGQLGIFSPWG